VKTSPTLMLDFHDSIHSRKIPVCLRI
jgi:hypothetical protein